ncbi:MAG: DUF2252 family protein [Alphaproteobacteria bacterium]
MATTRAYERWLRRHLGVVERDLALKHKLMAQDPFSFMRATFYRWVAVWQATCAELAAAPRVLAIGDLHVENFGTWRDAEGRLVWGINDVDEAAAMPYAIDLVRLATSALLARGEEHLAITPKAACKAILAGYRKQLGGEGHAFVLEESHDMLRKAALSVERDPRHFWAKMALLPDARAPASVRKLLAAHLPDRRMKYRVAHRVSGLGSLGRPRYVALASWQGGQVVREAKAMLPSAYGWAIGQPEDVLHCRTIIERAVRCQDPHFAFSKRYLVRRLGPHCSRIELSMLPRAMNEVRILDAMGRETANLHLGSAAMCAAVRADLAARPRGWLLAAAKAMHAATLADWKTWKALRRA